MYYLNRVLLIIWIIVVLAGFSGFLLKITNADANFWGYVDGFAVYTWGFFSCLVLYALVTGQVAFKWTWALRKTKKEVRYDETD